LATNTGWGWPISVRCGEPNSVVPWDFRLVQQHNGEVFHGDARISELIDQQVIPAKPIIAGTLARFEHSRRTQI
jgi:hypothetical protein